MTTRLNLIGTIIGRIILLLGIVAGPFLVFSASREMDDRSDVRRHGKVTPGTITGLDTADILGRRGYKTYRLRVQYVPENVPETSGYFEVTKDFFKSKAPNEVTIRDTRCEVRYLPSAPSQAIIVGGSKTVDWYGIPLGILYFVTGIGAAYYTIHQWTQRTR